MKKTLLAIAAVIGLTLTTLFGGVSTGPPSGGGGGATNVIQMLNGTGTNTALVNPTINGSPVGTAAQSNATAFVRAAGQFWVDNYGATNPMVVWSIAGSISSNSTLLTVNGGNFTSADVGKLVAVQWAGVTNHSLISYISNVVNSATIGLSNAAMSTVAFVTVKVGSDNYLAISNANYAACQYIISNNVDAYVMFPALYMIGTNLIDPSSQFVASGHANAQFKFPEVARSEEYAAALHWVGTSQPNFGQGGESSNFFSVTGSGIWSCLNSTNGAHILNGEDFNSAIYFGGGNYSVYGNNLTFIGENLLIGTEPGSVMDAVYCEGFNGVVMNHVRITKGQAEGICFQPTDTRDIGFTGSGSQNSGHVTCYDLGVSGFYAAFGMTEHMNMYAPIAVDCMIACLQTNGGGHDNYFYGADFENVRAWMQTLGAPGPAITHFYHIAAENNFSNYWSYPSVTYSNSGAALLIQGDMAFTASQTPQPTNSGAGLMDVKGLPYNQPSWESREGSFGASNVSPVTLTFPSNNVSGVPAVPAIWANNGQPGSMMLNATSNNTTTWFPRIFFGATAAAYVDSVTGIYNGYANGLLNTFNGTTTASIPVLASGVTNTANRYGTAVVSSTATTYTNWDGAGNMRLTNTSVTGTLTFPLGPGAKITAASGLSGQLIFQ